jgi:hypothetical protein
MLQLLDFPDEVLCKIFEYLSPFDALYSFHNLNLRFNRLLIPFKQQIDLTYLSYEQFMYYINILLPLINKEEILYIIKLGNKRTPGQIKLFNTLMSDENNRNYLINIDTVLIEYPQLDEFNDFVRNILLSLPRLITLEIKVHHIRDEYFQKWTQLIVNSILSIPNLIKLSIEMPTGLVLSRLSNTIMFNSLIDLTLNLSLVTDLLILVQRIPNIKNLSVRIGWWTSGDRTLVKMLDEMRTNNPQTSVLNHLEKFYLTIDSILTFQFEHLEQVLYRILNRQITTDFSFVLRNCLNHNSELTQLIDGVKWENVLSGCVVLNKFDLFIRISGCLSIDEEQGTRNSFKSKYFLKKKWSFSYFKYSVRGNILFYSIPYKNHELFDILLNNDQIFNHFPINYASKLLIEQTNHDQYEYNPSILYHFPSLQQLNLIHFNINSSAINPINLSSLHTLKIDKERNINLSNLLQLLPLINTLLLSYYTIDNPNKSLENILLPRIIDLSIIDIPADGIQDILFFLNHFPNLHYLHIHICNRRMTDEYLLINLNEIIRKCQSIICVKLQLEKDLDLSVNWNLEFNGRVKMFLTDIIFDGILVRLWF